MSKDGNSRAVEFFWIDGHPLLVAELERVWLGLSHPGHQGLAGLTSPGAQLRSEVPHFRFTSLIPNTPHLRNSVLCSCFFALCESQEDRFVPRSCAGSYSASGGQHESALSNHKESPVTPHSYCVLQHTSSFGSGCKRRFVPRV